MLRPLMVEGRPHWETRFPEELWPVFEDFRNFLFHLWHHLGLPDPTEAQYEIAHRLQYGADTVEWESLSSEERDILLTSPREDIIRALRGLGKSYVAAAFVIWRLMRNPRDEKILVVSATRAKAIQFVDQVKAIIQSMVLCTWLLEGEREGGARRRDGAERFDVAGASMSQSYSVRAASITAQTTGDRSTLIIPDDVEIPENSKTEEARSTIIRNCREFGAIAKTEHGRGDIIYLGTPQTEESVYNTLVKELGFKCFTIPARFPAADKLDGYVLKRDETGELINILAPYLRKKHDDGRLAHLQPTDTRFSDEELLLLEAKGRAYFALQYMLDTSLSDAERYPLKQHDLIVLALNPGKAPITVQWGRDSDKRNVIQDIPNLGFTGDFFLRPLFLDQEWRAYDGKVLWVDPAGRGKDETAWAIMGHLSGMLFLLKVGAYKGDPAEAMRRIAIDAKAYNVNVVEVEPNYGQGMWITAFNPILAQIWPGGCTVQESEWAKGQKETRIIDTLEPVMTAHRLVVDESLIREDIRTAEERDYSLMYQLTHITRERKALRHEDRLEAVAGAAGHFMRTVGMDTKEAAQAILDAEKDAMIEEFVSMFEEGFPMGRGRQRGRMNPDGTHNEVTQVWI